MIGTITNKNGRLVIKSGYKKIKFDSRYININDSMLTVNYKNYNIQLNDTKIFIFHDRFIIHEGMCYIILNNCIISDEQYDTAHIIPYINQEHMKRFKERYGQVVSNLDLSNFESLDVIDIDNINNINIKTNFDLKDCNCYSISSTKIELCGKGTDLRSGSKCLYLMVPNTWHRMNINGSTTLEINRIKEKNSTNLLFLRFTPKPVME
jgi:hypothetical protein